MDTLVALGHYGAMMCGSRNQFSLTRAASSTGRRAKSNFLSITHVLHLSEELHKNLPQPAQVQAQSQRIASIAEEAVDNIGEIVWANNPDYDTLGDLVAYLREYAANFFADTATRIQFDFPEAVPCQTVSGLFRHHVLLLVKEALQNVMKHAQADLVTMRLVLSNNHLELCIADNGCGLASNSAAESGNGLPNMRHRVSELEGTLEIASQPGKGTEVRVFIPLI